MSALSKFASSISASVEAPDTFSDALQHCSEEVHKFLEYSGEPSEPCPLAPAEFDTPEKQAAWANAHKLKAFAGQATKHHKNKISRQIKRKHRKDGNPISESQADALAESVVSTACNSPLEEMAQAILETP